MPSERTYPFNRIQLEAVDEFIEQHYPDVSRSSFIRFCVHEYLKRHGLELPGRVW